MKCQTTYAKAVTETLHEEMERFPELFILGQDITRPEGAEGAFKITTDLPKRFPERVIGTILNESSIVGNGIGIALRGGKAICEMQFADFATEAVKMIRNYAAPLHYRHGLKLSVVIRMPSGIIGSAGQNHSVSPEALFFNEPGLIILAPSTPAEAKGLLKAAIRAETPTIFIEWKRLYSLPSQKQKYPEELDLEMPDKDHVLPIGKARLLREGRDLTIISYGPMLFEALKAGDALKEKGFSAEIMDLRSLMPFDWEMISESVKKTGRVIIAHEDKKIGGIGMTMAQMISEELFDHLDAPPTVVGAPFIPIPHHPNLENAYLPNFTDIVFAAEENILPAAPKRRAATIAAAPKTEEARKPKDPRIERISFSPIQKLVAPRMTRNHLKPHVHDNIEADATRIWNDREENRIEFEKRLGTKLTLTHYFAYAAIKTLMREEHHKLRSEIEEKTPISPSLSDILNALELADTYIKKDYVNLAFAVALPNNDLLEAVVKDAHLMKFSELALAINDLAERSRNKKVLPDELRGGNFTITNVGKFGILWGNSILSDNQVATLAIGAAKDSEGRKKVILNLAFDHRLINGSDAGLFQSALKEFLENWNVDIFGD